jgi:hypothetical protein
VLPDRRVAVLEGEDHLAILTAPELVADEVVRFLSAGHLSRSGEGEG